jgi:signal recognition particle GTPase
MPDEKPEKFDADALRTDLARIRAKLKRLDTERIAAIEQLEQAMAEVERKLAERHEQQPPPA